MSSASMATVPERACPFRATASLPRNNGLAMSRTDRKLASKMTPIRLDCAEEIALCFGDVISAIKSASDLDSHAPNKV